MCALGDELSSVRTISGWRETWRQLRVAAWSLNSDCRRELCAPRSLGAPQASEFRAELQTAGDARAAWEQDVWEGVAQVRRKVLNLSRALPFARSPADARTLVSAAERDLALLRERHRLEDEALALEERSLTDTLEGLQVRFEAWVADPAAPSAASASASASAAAASKRRTTGGTGTGTGSSGGGGSLRYCSMPSNGACRSGDDESAQLRRRIEKLSVEEHADGGSTGGWADDDHDTFMRLLWRKGHQPSATFLQELGQLLPHLAHEVVVAHVAWLQRSEARKEEQRQLLAEWRAGQRPVVSGGPPRPSPATAASAAQARGPAQSSSAVDREAEEARTEAAGRQEAWKKGEAQREERRQRVAQWKEAKEAAQTAREAEQVAKLGDERQRLDLQRQRAKGQAEAAQAFRQRKSEVEAAEKEALARSTQPISCEARLRIAHRSNTLLERIAREKAARALSDKQSTLKSLKDFEPPQRSSWAADAFKHVASRVYEDAEGRALKRSNSTGYQGGGGMLKA